MIRKFPLVTHLLLAHRHILSGTQTITRVRGFSHPQVAAEGLQTANLLIPLGAPQSPLGSVVMGRAELWEM